MPAVAARMPEIRRSAPTKTRTVQNWWILHRWTGLRKAGCIARVVQNQDSQWLRPAVIVILVNLICGSLLEFFH